MGSTTFHSVSVLLHQDHPHIHGEHGLGKWPISWRKGSPPYTWGAPALKVVIKAELGITPIYMGSTANGYLGKWGYGDHPHIHGEHFKTIEMASLVVGSPPYTWGALQTPQSTLISQRITPIYMGSTVTASCAMLATEDHPHIHGEHLMPDNREYEPIRITPIYMGSTQIANNKYYDY